MTAAVRSPTLAGPSRVEYDVPDMVFPFSREDLLEEIFQDEKVLETALNVLQNNRDVQLCNNLLQVLLELDFGSTVYFVTKACEKEAESAVKKMAVNLAANPRLGVIGAISPGLFRETTSNILILVEFFRITGTSYLQTVLQDMMVQVEAYAKLNHVMGGIAEVAVGATVVGADKSDRLLAITSQLVLSILKTPPSKLPATIRYVCKYMHTCLLMEMKEHNLAVTADESTALMQLVVAHLLGVRFFGLGLTCPSLFLLPEPRSEFSQDSLLTLSNLLMNLIGIPTSKADVASIPTPLHIHASNYTADAEAFFAAIHKNKTNYSAFEAHRSQLTNWLAQVPDFNDLENKPTSPLAFFALETCGTTLSAFLCEHALDFILACEPALNHRPILEFFASNSERITQIDLERRAFKPQIVLGPGIWNPVQYGRAWNFEIKLPSIRIQDIFVWIPTTVTLPSPSANRSTLDWILKGSGDNEYMLLLICQVSSKVSASVQKYIRIWKKIYPEVTSTKGQLMAVTQAQLSQSSYISKKLGANFPLVFDHHEHIASYFRVGSHGNNVFGSDDVTVILVDAEGRLVSTFDNFMSPKTIMNAVANWKTITKKPKGAMLKRRKTFKRNGSESSDSEDPHIDPSTPRG